MEAKNVLLFVIIVVLLYIVVKYVISDVNTLTGLVSAQTMQKIDASNLASSSSAGATSNYSYSIWFYIDDWNVKYGEPKVVFGRMASEVDKKQPCPLVSLAPLENNIIVSLAIYPGQDTAPIDDTTSTTDSTAVTIHKCMVANVPIQKWVNLLISTYGRTLDIYIDGKLVRTCVLPGVARIESSTPV